LDVFFVVLVFSFLAYYECVLVATSRLPRLLKSNKVVANSMPDLAEARANTEKGEGESIVEDVDVDTISEWDWIFSPNQYWMVKAKNCGSSCADH
jgi:hypothetical protein